MWKRGRLNLNDPTNIRKWNELIGIFNEMRVGVVRLSRLILRFPLMVRWKASSPIKIKIPVLPFDQSYQK